MPVKKQIDFSAMVDFNGIDFMEPFDISTIFGNAIDNAIEASEKLPEELRLITVRAERIRDMLIITVENHTMPDVSPVEGTTKKDRFIHGFGIPNIKNAVEKYGGQCSFRQEKRNLPAENHYSAALILSDNKPNIPAPLFIKAAFFLRPFCAAVLVFSS